MLELEITNMQVLCETCNCDIKKTRTMDFRSKSNIKVLESHVGHPVKILYNQKPAWKEREDRATKARAAKALATRGVKKKKITHVLPLVEARNKLSDALKAKRAAKENPTVRPGKYTKERVLERKRKRAIKTAKHEANRKANLELIKPHRIQQAHWDNMKPSRKKLMVQRYSAEGKHRKANKRLSGRFNTD